MMENLPLTRVADLANVPDGSGTTVTGIVAAYPAQLAKEPLFPIRFARLAISGTTVACELGEHAFYLYAAPAPVGATVSWFGFFDHQTFTVTAHNHRLIPMERGPECPACLELALGGSYYEWRELHRRIAHHRRTRTRRSAKAAA